MLIFNNKKNIVAILFILMAFLIYDGDCFAFEDFPNYTPEDMAEYENYYCRYSTGYFGKDLTGLYSPIGTHYRYKNFYLAYENGEIVWFLRGETKSFNSGYVWYTDEYETTSKEYDDLGNRVTVTTKINEAGRVVFLNPTGLKNYLVENGELNCKPLAFMENESQTENNGKLYRVNDLIIITPEDNEAAGAGLDSKVFHSGRLFYQNNYKGGKNVKKCSTDEINKINQKSSELISTFRSKIDDKIGKTGKSNTIRSYTTLNSIERVLDKELNYASEDDDIYTVYGFESKTSSSVLHDQIYLSEQLRDYVMEFGCSFDTESFITNFNSQIKNIGDEYFTELKNKTNEIINNGGYTEEEKANLIANYEKRINDIMEISKSYFENFAINFDDVVYGKLSDDSCQGILGQDLLDEIKNILNWVRILVPILLIALGSLDFGKAVLSDDAKALQKAGKDFLKRAIAAIAIFFIPYLIMYLLDFVNYIGKNSCDVRGL